MKVIDLGLDPEAEVLGLGNEGQVLGLEFDLVFRPFSDILLTGH